MSDPFQVQITRLDSPAAHHFAIIPSDTDDLPIRPRAIRVGEGGTLVLRDALQTEISYTVMAGEVLVFRALRVMATGTTATNIVGWY